ncbi:MAG: TetR/AcrR family transcriptional regulator [Acidobacteriota bacterium]|nr:TetR/AcrR family transcriptional regulator [Acidobacteriota bacterium]
MTKQARSQAVMSLVLDAVAERLMTMDETLIRIPEICEATGVNYGSVYHHFGSREGVIDAAYHLMFTRLVAEDFENVANVMENATTFEEYVFGIIPLISSVSSGEERRARRALRARIVAAATTRLELRVLIAHAQAEHTKTLARLVRFGQERQWLRDDVDPQFVAVLLQNLLIGRVLDDVSLTPISDDLWERNASVLFVSMLTNPLA